MSLQKVAPTLPTHISRLDTPRLHVSYVKLLATSLRVVLFSDMKTLGKKGKERAEIKINPVENILICKSKATRSSTSHERNSKVLRELVLDSF